MRRTVFALLAAFLPGLAFATVNVNTAQQTELQRTKGLDKYKAKSLIEYRARNGSIDNFGELAQVPGFTPEVIEKVKTELAFNGDAFVPPKAAEKKKKG
jgi:competence protein ComEA